MRRLRNGAAIALVLAILSTVAAIQIFTIALDRAAANGLGTLRLATASLAGHLERYEALPALVSDQPELRAVLAAPDDPARRRDANLLLADLAARLAITDAYVMLPDGMTIAASNFDAVSFVGQNFRYRPYFQAAAEGRQGRFFGLGTTSDRRGFYFSDAIRDGAGRVVGILALKIDLDPIEATWASNDTEILVLDPENIVFMAGRPEWRYRIFGASDAVALERSAEVRRYAREPVTPLEVHRSQAFDGTATLVVGSGREAREFQALYETMPEAGWTVMVLADTQPASRQALTAGLAVFLLLALASVGVAVERSRRRRSRERRNAEAAAKLRLESEVAQRTFALAQANHRLEREIGERRATEERLRRTQSDLVEAGKLAALGQMSAALSHEFNQPLAAASAYADNAALFLQRGATEKAGETIGRVSDLLGRLSAISRTLRNFARRPEDELSPVDVGKAVEDAMGIAGHRLKAVGATVEISPGLSGIEVEGVAIRLQQVLVNLLTNAADAVEESPVRRIAIRERAEPDGRVSILVEDTGPGVAPSVANRIFDPFFTSKASGKGLGLGLSISYNIVSDFGGRLVLERAESGGARFVVELVRAQPQLRSAAE